MGAIRSAGWGLLGLCVSAVLVTEQSLAQDEPQNALRMDELATGTRTARLGVHLLDTDKPVYVPQSCVGTRRCPLLVGAGWLELVPVAEKYGMILLLSGTVDARDLKEVLRKFAIDPAKIAFAGSGSSVEKYQGLDFSMFSRIAMFAADADPPVPSSRQKQATGYFLSSTPKTFSRNLQSARMLREQGYAVQHAAVLIRWPQAHDYDLLAQWLQTSWRLTDTVMRPDPDTVDDPPLLTNEALAQLVAFWNRMVRMPDSIRTAARLAQMREVVMSLGAERVSIVMEDMAVLAAQYPSVADALQAAGLTARQHDAYRGALAGAHLVKHSTGSGDGRVSLAPTSALAKNVAFLKAHPGAFDAREFQEMWMAMWLVH